MDYEKILEEQMNNVIDPDQAADITNKASEITGGLSDIFSLDKIVKATLEGESIFDNQEMIDSLKSLAVYEIRAALVLGIEILVICIIIGLLKNLSSSLGKKSMSDISLLVCTMIIIGISIKHVRNPNIIFTFFRII